MTDAIVGSLKAAGPFIASTALSTALILTPAMTGVRTSGTIDSPIGEAHVYVNIGSVGSSAPYASTPELGRYIWEFSRPELAPDSFVVVTSRDIYEYYESFIASEGWIETTPPGGPFIVEEEAPRAFFDPYDISTISLYESE